MTTRTATCACGQLTVTCRDEPMRVSLCHCPDCQKRTGSTYGIAAFYAREDISAEGQTKAFERGSKSGYNVLFHFCPDCGSTVYWEPARMPDLIGVAVGAFADPTFPAPTQSVWQDWAHPWVVDPH